MSISHVIYISFDQVIQHLIPKFSKKSLFFLGIEFFSIRKAASHMIFLFPKHLKTLSITFKNGHLTMNYLT